MTQKPFLNEAPPSQRHLVARIVLLLFLLGLFCGAAWLAIHAVLRAKDAALSTDASPLLTVNVLDIGQGDAIHLRTRQGTDVLIDGGPDSSVLSELSAGMPFSDRSLEVVLLTHPHADHAAGLVPVLNRYDVGHVFANPEAPQTDAGDAFFATVARKKLPLTTPFSGERLDLGEGIQGTMLYPFKETVGRLPADDANAFSIVLRVDAGRTCFLFTGDLPQEEEAELLSTLPPEQLTCDVLKVGHHGSKTSSSEAFLDVVKPRFALVSVGAGNTYGHPHPDMLRRFAERGVRLFRTDQDGTISCTTDGADVSCASRTLHFSLWGLFR